MKPIRKHGTITPETIKPTSWEPIEIKMRDTSYRVCSTTGCEDKAHWTLFSRRVDRMGRRRMLNFCDACMVRLPNKGAW